MSFIERFREAKAAVTGGLLRSDLPEESAIIDARAEICEKCPALRKPLYQCAECGCFVKIKGRFKEAACPLGKW